MKHFFLFLALSFSLSAFSAVGDSTWVQTFGFDEPRQSAWTWKVDFFDFPDGNVNYEKIVMYYTVKCDPTAASPYFCGEWDYLAYTELIEHTGSFVETEDGEQEEVLRYWQLGKYITPYGGGLDLEDGYTFYYDVSDFVHLLKGRVHLRDLNFQEMIDIKFLFIEGTPPRDVIQIRQVWQNNNYPLSIFDDLVTDTTFVLSEDEKQARLRCNVTGHGFGQGNNCAEFCSNIHKIKVDGKIVESWDIMQPCGSNPIYPQGGTWLYDRAGWCPGMEGKQRNIELTQYIKNNSINFDYDIDYDPYGNYDTQIELVTYGDFHQRVDVSMESIIAPSNLKLWSRFNPTCRNPFICFRNIGSEPITSLTVTYGMSNSDGTEMITPSTYQWTGWVGSLFTQDIYLPIPNWDEVTSSSGVFYVILSNPNGVTDPTPHNNKMNSTFEMVRKVSYTEFEMNFRTNHAPNETSWTLLHAWGGTVSKSGTVMNANSTYQVPITLEPGCYQLRLDDSNGDGLEFWANMYPNGNGTAGSAILKRKLNSSSYAIFHSANPDFGNFYQFDFAVERFVGVQEEILRESKVQLYPNPAEGIIFIDVNDSSLSATQADIYDITGRKILTDDLSQNTKSININQLSKGIYIMLIRSGEQEIARKKFVVGR